MNSSDYEALELAYVKLRHDLLENIDNAEAQEDVSDYDPQDFLDRIEHMVQRLGIRASVAPQVEERLLPEVAPEKVRPEQQTGFSIPTGYRLMPMSNESDSYQLDTDALDEGWQHFEQLARELIRPLAETATGGFVGAVDFEGQRRG